ncbi:MAG: hypothetical protein BGO44_16185 [Legionella sp. 39-23]|nr:MAG: hypothetical protein BGO44_16185 [Legionella sp. 39-23]
MGKSRPLLIFIKLIYSSPLLLNKNNLAFKSIKYAFFGALNLKAIPSILSDFHFKNDHGTNVELRYKAAIMRKNTSKGKEKLSHYQQCNV